MPQDPRWLQIGSLGALLAYGVVALDLEVGVGPASVLIATCLAIQWVGTRLVGLPAFDPKSALISGLSLSLLLRTSDPLWLIAAPILTIGSKFVLRVDGRHVFNPTNFGLAAAMLLSGSVWVSPGQWGSVAVLGFAAVCLGSLVVRRAERSDVTWAFLAAWVGLLFGRALWLGDPLAIPLHQLSNGALLIFAFFMISDPKTTPNRRAGRVLFACLVAGVAYVLRFEFFNSNALLWALAGCSPLVPVVNRLLAGRRYEWPGLMPDTSGRGARRYPHTLPGQAVASQLRVRRDSSGGEAQRYPHRAVAFTGPREGASPFPAPPFPTPPPSLSVVNELSRTAHRRRAGAPGRRGAWLGEATPEGAASTATQQDPNHQTANRRTPCDRS